jgi:hypothetical protein
VAFVYSSTTILPELVPKLHLASLLARTLQSARPTRSPSVESAVVVVVLVAGWLHDQPEAEVEASVVGLKWLSLCL